ncbi:MAG: right-handed parallel beta-helix repeat-containing protein, partial [bacterium]
GILAMNLTASDNRIISGTNGMEFLDSDEQNLQLIANIQISQNFITAQGSGIKVNNPAIIVYDFTAFDNSIVGSSEFGIILRGLDENLFLPEDVASFQRAIQRNSVQVKGAGIVIGVSDAKILDNDITIKYAEAHQQNISYGIVIMASNCTAANNTLQGVIDLSTNIRSKGGIYIFVPPSHKQDARSKKIIIRANRISGGIANGIEIASNIDNVVIESNLIHKMGLNGIAVDSKIQSTNNMIISNNKISRCNQLVGAGTSWWKYAGIVLKSGEKIQITGNEICENGRDITNPGFLVGGIYAEQVRNVIIANNQLINNGLLSENFVSLQAVIHVPAIPTNSVGNEDIKVVNNLVQGSRAPALFLGGEFNCFKFNNLIICFGQDTKTIISGNHFESLITGPTVQLQSNHCIFSNNYIECPDSPNVDAVDLGYGWYLTATGNISSSPISGAGWVLVIEHNVIFYLSEDNNG